MKNIVYLVDNKKRDLPGVVLLSYYLEKMGIKCNIEPLESWKACLYKYKPDMIIFNHLLGSHLVEYSKYLKEVGILVGVLPNEGILYNKEVLDFNASKFHNGAHIDYFFVWNEAHKDAILKGNKLLDMKVEIIGVPRFDFYFPPFKQVLNNEKKTILICTNFVFSQFLYKDKSIAEKLFAPWKGRIESYSDYWGLIKTNAKSRELFFDFLNEIVNSKKYKIILKPHPSEDTKVYDDWYNSLNKNLKMYVDYDKTSFIWELIPKCDIEIACETCTTSLESWIAGKKTIELELTQHPVFYHEFISKMSSTCKNPEKILDLIEDVLEQETSEEQNVLRVKHLEKWCDSPNGNSTFKLATIINNAISDVKPDFSNIKFSYKRKSYKLSLLDIFRKPYNYDLFLNFKSKINFSKYGDKIRVYNKTVTKDDISFWREKIFKLMEDNSG